MLPTLELGPWQVSTYHVTGTLALITAGMWAFHRLLSLDHPPGIIIRGLFLAILGGFAGTYLITYLINVRRVARSGLLARPEGMSIIWGLVSVISVATVYYRRHQISIGCRCSQLPAPENGTKSTLLVMQTRVLPWIEGVRWPKPCRYGGKCTHIG